MFFWENCPFSVPEKKIKKCITIVFLRKIKIVKTAHRFVFVSSGIEANLLFLGNFILLLEPWIFPDGRSLDVTIHLGPCIFRPFSRRQREDFQGPETVKSGQSEIAFLHSLQGFRSWTCSRCIVGLKVHHVKNSQKGLKWR